MDLHSGHRIQFQMGPRSIRDQKVAKIKITDYPGSDMPIVTSPGGGKRTVSFSMHFWADSQEQDIEYVKSSVDFLYSLMYPRIVNDNSGQVKVTPCYVILGDLIQLPCHVQRVFAAWGPFNNPSMGPLMCRVDIDIIEIGGDVFIDALSARDSLSRLREQPEV